MKVLVLSHKSQTCLNDCQELLETKDQTEISGPVRFIHQWIDMTNQEVPLPDGTIVKTCPPAMGYSFAAGTTDGPGAFSFEQVKRHLNSLHSCDTEKF